MTRPLPETFGRYRILRPLGEGGMGAVYLARDTQLDRLVALKVPRLGGDAKPAPGDLERFLREARAAAALLHPNLCPIFDAGEVDGTPYMTMAYLEGRLLSSVIEKGKPPSQRQATLIVRKLATALQEAHARGVIHRDLKPANVMINPRGEPIVMDFGLARRDESVEARLTKDGTVLGTPAYMPPEQVRGETRAIGPACDIYALGVIFYELLAGRLPFEGSVMTVLGKILTEPSPPPSRFRPDLDPELEAICLKAMAKKVEDRHASMAELAAALAVQLRAMRDTTRPCPAPGRRSNRGQDRLRRGTRVPPRRPGPCLLRARLSHPPCRRSPPNNERAGAIRTRGVCPRHRTDPAGDSRSRRPPRSRSWRSASRPSKALAAA